MFSGLAKSFDVVVIGAGIVGLGTAVRLAEAVPQLRIAVLDKANRLAAHQTGHNSGVLHSGLYYQPGSLKARLCIEGREALVRFAAENGVAHEVCGKVVVATEEAELPQLEKIEANGRANGLTRIERIDSVTLRDHEPFCQGIAGLWVPYTGIVDFHALCAALASRLKAINPLNEIRLNSAVHSLESNAGYYSIGTSNDRVTAGFIVSCAGLQSDRLARLDGLRPPMRIVPFRGDYYELVPEARRLVRNLIYPVPDPAFPFLGVHFTRMTDGTVECGPNAVFAFARDGYSKTAFNSRDTAEALGFSGTWRLFRQHYQRGWAEYRRAFSKRRFLKTLQRLVPALSAAAIVPGRCGVRAMALQPNGALVDDFLIEEGERSFHVLNAPSPAATAGLSIGSFLTDRILPKLA